MEKEMSAVLESVLRYERREYYICCVLLGIAVVAVLCAALFTKRKKLVHKLIIGGVLLVLTGAFAAYTVQVNADSRRIQNDMEQAVFVTYQGEFTHDDYQKDSYYHYISITDPSGGQLRLRLPDYGNMHRTYADYRALPTGTCTGMLVYSKSSKIIIKWEVHDDHGIE